MYSGLSSNTITCSSLQEGISENEGSSLKCTACACPPVPSECAVAQKNISGLHVSLSSRIGSQSSQGTSVRLKKKLCKGKMCEMNSFIHLHADADLGGGKANPGCLSHGCNHCVYQVLQVLRAKHLVWNSICNLRHLICLKSHGQPHPYTGMVP